MSDILVFNPEFVCVDAVCYRNAAHFSIVIFLNQRLHRCNGRERW